MNNLEVIKLEHVFKTLGNRKRLALLIYLFSGEATINRLSIALDLPYKTVERNLIRLQEAGFLNKRTISRQAYFSINVGAKAEHLIIINIIKEKANKFDPQKMAMSLLKTAKTMEDIHIEAIHTIY